MVDRLEAGGLVVRQADALDRRVNRIVITSKGHRILERMVEIGRRLNGVVLDGIAAEDLAAADRVLTLVRRNLRQALQDSESGDAATAD
jgi:DNA-binding MarR family transcriptional regulator